MSLSQQSDANVDSYEWLGRWYKDTEAPLESAVCAHLKKKVCWAEEGTQLPPEVVRSLQYASFDHNDHYMYPGECKCPGRLLNHHSSEGSLCHAAPYSRNGPSVYAFKLSQAVDEPRPPPYIIEGTFSPSRAKLDEDPALKSLPHLVSILDGVRKPGDALRQSFLDAATDCLKGLAEEFNRPDSTLDSTQVRDKLGEWTKGFLTEEMRKRVSDSEVIRFVYMDSDKHAELSNDVEFDFERE